MTEEQLDKYCVRVLKAEGTIYASCWKVLNIPLDLIWRMISWVISLINWCILCSIGRIAIIFGYPVLFLCIAFNIIPVPPGENFNTILGLVAGICIWLIFIIVITCGWVYDKNSIHAGVVRNQINLKLKGEK
jgi:hypothetical protein